MVDPISEDAGASAVEYALFLALIAAVIFFVVVALGQQVLALFRTVEGGF